MAAAQLPAMAAMLAQLRRCARSAARRRERGARFLLVAGLLLSGLASALFILRLNEEQQMLPLRLGFSQTLGSRRRKEAEVMTVEPSAPLEPSSPPKLQRPPPGKRPNGTAAVGIAILQIPSEAGRTRSVIEEKICLEGRAMG